MKSDKLRRALSQHGVQEEEALKLAKTVAAMAGKGTPWQKQADRAEKRLQEEYGLSYSQLEKAARYGQQPLLDRNGDENAGVEGTEELETTNLLNHYKEELEGRVDPEPPVEKLGNQVTGFDETDFRMLAALKDLLGREEYDREELVVTSREKVSETSLVSTGGPAPKSRDYHAESSSLSTLDQSRVEEIEATLEALEGKDGSLAQKQRESLQDELEALQS